MTPARDDDDEPTLTDELRAFIHPHTGRWMLVLVIVSVALIVLGLVASRTVLAPLWH